MDNWHEGLGDCVPARVGSEPVRMGHAPVRRGNMLPCVDNAPARGGYAQNRRGNARWKRIKYKAWGNAPGTHPPNYCRATGATQRKQNAMSLLGWPRRSLFSIKVIASVIAASMTIAGKMIVCVMGIMDIVAAITPTATFAPVARIDCGRRLPGALPQALYCCAYGARSLRGRFQYTRNGGVSSCLYRAQ